MERYRTPARGLRVLSLSLVVSLAACGDEASPEIDEQFEMCLAEVEPECSVVEMDTAEKLEQACLGLSSLSIPLTDGTTYGPEVTEGGAYGGKLDWNQGADTEFVNEVNPLEPSCLPFGVQTFNEPEEVNAQLLNTRDIDYSLYTVFRPACMKQGETYPVITWANGTCGLTHGYAVLLAGLASYGYVIVASNSTWTNTGVTSGVQARALDYAEALNEDPDSILYERLDLDNVGAMGHSQGAAATRVAARDERVKSVLLWNGGVSEDKPFLNVSGERDVNKDITPESMATETEDASQPGAWVYYKQVLETGGNSTGHLVLMEQPERVIDLAVAWWDYWLKGDKKAKAKFVGDDCGFCNMDEEFAIGANTKFD